ncbi:MAG: YidB family protein [Chthoniobacterales bacterium]
MSLFDSVIGAVTGNNPQGQPQANPLIGIVSSVLTQSGGVQGLMNQFSQAGLGNVFSSWVSNGPNPPVTAEQIQQVLGSDQVKALANKFGLDPAQVSHAVAEHLPTVVDKLTPSGNIDASTNIEQALVTMLPSLLSKLNLGASPSSPPPAS